ncbi:MAG: sugar phosphate isomerase/epimerase [Acidobacteria bacterium]|nr:sugar phosphate isomerase/epimerase [Acidobacteriota bacterium]MCI0626814.1 sugar phosphate isomerase/epimerase [Acidobacteriota bacterium]
MKQGLSTHLFVEEKLGLHRLKEVRASGFETLEIFALKPHFDYQDKKLTTELGSWLADQDGFLRSLHTPFCMDYQARASREWLSIADPERLRREKAVDEIRRSLEFSEKVSLPLAVVHMGAPEDRFSSRHLDAIYYSLETLMPFAEARGVKLALENIPNELSAIERMRRFLEDAQLPEVGICFDSGHSHLQADAHAEIRDGGPWIVSTHLHDNHKKKDEHLLPFDGSIDWAKILEAFDAVQYSGNLILELKAWNRPPETVLKLAQERLDRFTKCQEELVEMKSREG